MASLSAKAKKGNVIHRTTSESLRLGDDLYKVPQTVGVRKKVVTSPSCSFQITGVLTRYDLEDESADDLDESHTDDISRVTDNETPSFSEDSRDTDDHQIQTQQTAVSVPTISESSEVNHVKLVPAEKEKERANINNNSVGRFTVVKMESIAPFSRGRWTCFDYLDDLSNISLGLDKIFGHEHHNINTTSSTSVNYLDVGNIVNEKNRSYWESNCQPPYLYTGSILMPQPIPIYVPVSSRPPQKVKKTYHSPLSQNILPMMIRPSAHVVDNFTTSALNLNTMANGNGKTKVNDFNNLVDNKKSVSLNSEVLNSGALELATKTIATCENNNSGKLASPKGISAQVHRDEEILEAMATSHPRAAESPVKESHHAATETEKNSDPSEEADLPMVIASVSCTATIDTKIEHALDVVKNHLTHAVRLEVEELKVKINELVERISYLEYENDLLRANVSPDVLATLSNTSEK